MSCIPRTLPLYKNTCTSFCSFLQCHHCSEFHPASISHLSWCFASLSLAMFKTIRKCLIDLTNGRSVQREHETHVVGIRLLDNKCQTLNSSDGQRVLKTPCGGTYWSRSKCHFQRLNTTRSSFFWIRDVGRTLRLVHKPHFLEFTTIRMQCTL